MDKLLEQGLGLMNRSVDKMHDLDHVNRIMELGKIIAKEEGLEKKVNWDRLKLIVAWHDAWKATHPMGGLKSMWRHYFYEGRGSAKMFTRAAKKAGMEKRERKLIVREIRNHPWFKKRAKRCLEGKILWDGDNLEVWNWQRIAPTVEKYKSVRLAEFYLMNFMMKRTDRWMYFAWSKKEFGRRKKEFSSACRRLLNFVE